MSSVNSCNRYPLSPHRRAILLIVFWIYAGSACAADIIAYPGVTVNTLSLNEARAIFAMRQLIWPDGKAVRVFVLPEQNPLHVSLCRENLNIYPYQLHQSWNRLVYSGTGQAPTEVASEQEMRARVMSTPGAIGYVNKVYSNDSIQTITVR